VGKGITFDTGGLDLKPTSNMVSMKTDMAGAAVALATVLALADLAAAGQELNLKVTAVLPLAQNAVGAASYRPSDVLTVYGGTRVEVGDTDAEGRLVLADALAFAVDQLDPDYLVDIATLTGAQRVALGDRTGAYFASDEALAQHLEQSGPVAGEDWWRLPLEDAYEELLDTPNADVNSIGREGSGAGAITAALFLRRFTAGRPWLHLDVAGPARATTTQAWTVKGATGFGVRSLIQLAQRLT
jgi:leucyl aminopeptidase